MRAPLRKQTKLIGAKWLRNGDGEFPAKDDAGESSQQQDPGDSANGAISGAKNSDLNVINDKVVAITDMMQVVGDTSAILNSNNIMSGEKGTKAGKRNVTILENKKRRTDTGHVMGLNTELDVDSEEEDCENMDQETENGPKNVTVAGSESRARLVL
ncbi:hypothetical protein AgCh_037471 [Apium graveolens]